jgi:hypothetical protein
VPGPDPQPVLAVEGGRPGLVLLAGLVVTAVLCAGLIALWPDDADDTRAETSADVLAGLDDPVPGATGGPSRGGGAGGPATPGREAPAGPSLFAGEAPGAVQAVIAAAGGPTQFMEIALYPSYGFVAYRDPAQPGHIDRRMWRDGEVDGPDPNPIDDRVDADTEPALFGLEGLDLGIIPQLVLDAATRYDTPVDVTHIIINRFLPFDERVLVRVYATPADGRGGGGYVSYDTAGALVKVCC